MDDSREWQSQEDLSDDLLFSDNKKELNNLKSEIDISLDPELKLLKDTHTALEVAIKKGDKDRETFTQKYKTLTKGSYLREERLLREALALQQTLAVEVAQLYRSLLSDKIKALDTQYWHYKNDVLPITNDHEKQQQIRIFLQKIDTLKQTYEDVLTESMAFHTYVKLMENKKYQGYRELVKLDPWDRYDKEAKAKAKRYATQ